MGCAGRVADGINPVHLSYVRENTGRAGRGAPVDPGRGHQGPVKSLVTGLPLDLRFLTKGALAIDILAAAYGDGLSLDFVCSDEVYGACTSLWEFLESRGQAYVLRVASNFTFALTAGTTLTCAEAVKKLLKRRQGWEVHCAGTGSKGERWYAWAWLATASRALPAGPPPPEDRRTGISLLLRPRRAAGVQGPADPGGGAALAAAKSFELGKGCFGLRPVPGPAYRDTAAHRAGHRRSGGLQSPQRRSGTAPTPRPRLPQARTPRRPLTPVLSRSPSARSATARQRDRPPKPPGHAARWLECAPTPGTIRSFHNCTPAA